MQQRGNGIDPARHIGVAAAGEHNDRILVGLVNGLNQIVLVRRKLEIAIGALAFRGGIITDEDNGRISHLRHLLRLRADDLIHRQHSHIHVAAQPVR